MSSIIRKCFGRRRSDDYDYDYSVCYSCCGSSSEVSELLLEDDDESGFFGPEGASRDGPLVIKIRVLDGHFLFPGDNNEVGLLPPAVLQPYITKVEWFGVKAALGQALQPAVRHNKQARHFHRIVGFVMLLGALLGMWSAYNMFAHNNNVAVDTYDSSNNDDAWENGYSANANGDDNIADDYYYEEDEDDNGDAQGYDDQQNNGDDDDNAGRFRFLEQQADDGNARAAWHELTLGTASMGMLLGGIMFLLLLNTTLWVRRRYCVEPKVGQRLRESLNDFSTSTVQYYLIQDGESVAGLFFRGSLSPYIATGFVMIIAVQRKVSSSGGNNSGVPSIADDSYDGSIANSTGTHGRTGRVSVDATLPTSTNETTFRPMKVPSLEPIAPRKFKVRWILPDESDIDSSSFMGRTASTASTRGTHKASLDDIHRQGANKNAYRPPFPDIPDVVDL